MIYLGIAALANQTLSAVIDGDRYVVTIKAAQGCMSATIARNGDTLVSGIRLVSGAPIIPYKYLASRGNFLITTEANDLPAWEQFGVTQFLVFASSSELAGG